MDEPPPPYSATTISQTYTPQRDPVMQLRRYLVEIMAFTFNVDSALLNHALGQDTLPTSASVSNTNSILTEDERVELLRLALITNDLYGKRGRPQFLATRDSDRRAVADGIVVPALQLELSATYILELISTYANHQCDKTKREHTLLYRNIPYPLCLFRHLTLLLDLFGAHLYSHALIISTITPNEHVHTVLSNAMRVFQEEELGIKKVPQCRNNVWPNKFGSWHDLWQDLISDEEEIEIYSQVFRRKRESEETKKRARIQ